MLWLARGHQFDDLVNDQFNYQIEKIYIYGCGEIGKLVYDCISVVDIDITFIDKNPIKEFCGCNVILLEQLDILKLNTSIIVVAAAEVNAEVMLRKLIFKGYFEGKNCFKYDRFLNFYWPLLSVYKFNKLISPYFHAITLVIGENCTLKCNNCNANIPYISDRYNPTFDDVKRESKLLFQSIDYIHQLRLSGGEPLLNKSFKDIISFLYSEYGTFFHNIEFTMNGTIIPDEDTLNIISKYDVKVCISDYSASLPRLKDNYNLIERKFKEKKISYTRMTDIEWINFGFNSGKYDNGDLSVLRRYDDCWHPCKDVRNGKLSSCSQALYASKRFNLLSGDINLQTETNKRVILEYLMGFFPEKGFPEACRYCSGHTNINKDTIDVAEQICD